VPYTLNTDGPYLLNTHLRQEFDMLLEQDVITPSQALRCVETARAASFIGV
jgi:adenosine deaminase